MPLDLTQPPGSFGSVTSPTGQATPPSVLPNPPQGSGDPGVGPAVGAAPPFSGQRVGGIDFSGPPGFLDVTAGAALVGARRDPLLKPIIDTAASMLGYNEAALDGYARHLQNSRTADVFEFIGQYGPTMALGIGAFGVGRIAGRAALGALSKEGAAYIAQEIGTAAVAKPLAMRAAEILGGSIGYGGYEGISKMAETGSFPEAAKAAAFGAALTAGFETGLAVLPYVPGLQTALGRARQVSDAPINARFEAKARPELEAVRAQTRQRIGRLNESLEKILGTDQQTKELLGTFGIKETRFSPLPAERKALAKINQRKAALATEDRALTGLINRKPVTYYTEDTPFNPTGMRLGIEKLKQGTVLTPEGYKTRGSRTVAALTEMYQHSEAESIIARDHNQAFLSSLRQSLSEALGFSNRQAIKTESWTPLFDAWETGGEAGVTGYLQSIGKSAVTSRVLGHFNELDTEMHKVYAKLASMGAEPMQRSAELAGRGLAKYYPHVLQAIPEEQLAERLTQAVGASEAARLMQFSQRRGLRRFGSIDFQRKVPGSLAAKAAKGLPVEADPWNAAFRYLNESHRRVAYGQRFGLNGELKTAIIGAATREGFSRPLVTTLVDSALGPRYYDEAMTKISELLISGQIASKLGLAVVTNATGPLNTVLYAGFRKSVKGLIATTRGERNDTIMKSIALSDSIVRGVGRTFGQERLRAMTAGSPMIDKAWDVAGQFGDYVLRGSGFNLFERFNRTHSGYTAEYVFKDNLFKALRGRLRGETLVRARRQVQSLGVDLDATVAAVKAAGGIERWAASKEGADTMRRAIFTGAQLTQFIPSPTRRPVWWNHPVGRVMTQFKTFGLGHVRLLKDQVFAEAALGNIKPIALMLSMYPIAGEAVKDIRSVVSGKERPDHGVQRYLNDVLAVGGLGMMTDAWTAARFGRLEGFVLGPTVSDMFDFAERMSHADVSGVLRQVERQPTFQGARFLTGAGIAAGQAASEAFTEAGIDKYLGELGGEDTEEDIPLVDLDQLRMEAARAKQQ